MSFGTYQGGYTCESSGFSVVSDTDVVVVTVGQVQVTGEGVSTVGQVMGAGVSIVGQVIGFGVSTVGQVIGVGVSVLGTVVGLEVSELGIVVGLEVSDSVVVRGSVVVWLGGVELVIPICSFIQSM